MKTRNNPFDNVSSTAQLASDALGDMLAESVESRIPAHGFGAIPLWCPDVAWGKK